MFVAQSKGATTLTLFLLCLGSTVALAQELDRYLQEIHQNNPAYLAASQRWQAAQAAIPAATALPDPTVGLGIYLSEVETRVGPQKQRISLAQKIPWRGKRALHGQKAQANVRRLKANLDAMALQLETQFKSQYADFFYLGRALNITMDHLQLLKDLEVLVTEKYETSTAKYTELIRIQIEVDALSDRLATQTAATRPLQAELNATLGRPVDALFPFPQTLPDLTLTDEMTQTAMTVLASHNPTLRGLDQQIQSEKFAVEIAKKNDLPDFTLGLDWINTGEAIMPGQPGSGRDPLIVSVGVNLPIWRKKYRSQERATRLQVEASVYQRRDAQATLEAQLKRALFQWDDAGRKLTLYRDQIIPKAEESLSVLTSEFQTGEATYLDLIDAEKALLEFLLSLYQAQSNQMKALAAIEAMVGKDLSTDK